MCRYQPLTESEWNMVCRCNWRGLKDQRYPGMTFWLLFVPCDLLCVHVRVRVCVCVLVYLFKTCILRHLLLFRRVCMCFNGGLLRVAGTHVQYISALPKAETESVCYQRATSCPVIACHLLAVNAECTTFKIFINAKCKKGQHLCKPGDHGTKTSRSRNRVMAFAWSNIFLSLQNKPLPH